MKKTILSCLLIPLMLLAGCQSSQKPSESIPETTAPTAPVTLNAPEISRIRAICELATLECYYHNVAKATKSKGAGIAHIGESDRTFWMEYIGTAKIGVDMSRVSMTEENNVYTISKELSAEEAGRGAFNDLPLSAMIQIKQLCNHRWGEGVVVREATITAADQTAAIEAAQQTMRETIETNSSLLVNAQDRAKKLIENYFRQLSELSDAPFSVRWNFEENQSNAQT